MTGAALLPAKRAAATYRILGGEPLKSLGSVIPGLSAFIERGRGRVDS